MRVCGIRWRCLKRRRGRRGARFGIRMRVPRLRSMFSVDRGSLMLAWRRLRLLVVRVRYIRVLVGKGWLCLWCYRCWRVGSCEVGGEIRQEREVMTSLSSLHPYTGKVPGVICLIDYLSSIFSFFFQGTVHTRSAGQQGTGWERRRLVYLPALTTKGAGIDSWDFCLRGRV